MLRGRAARTRAHVHMRVLVRVRACILFHLGLRDLLVDVVVTYIVVAYISMAYIFMAYVVMGYVVMAYIVMAS